MSVTKEQGDLFWMLTHRIHDNWVAYVRIWSRRSLSYGRAQTCRKQSSVSNSQKAVVRHADIRDQNRSLGMICPGDPHQRNPNAPKKMRFGLKKRRKGKSGVPVKQRGGGPKCPDMKEKLKTTFISPFGELVVYLRPSTIKPEAREFVVDSSASMHMIGEKVLNSAELETLKTSRSPTTVITANGQVQTNEEATVYVTELGIFLTMKVLEDSSAVLSLGKLCGEHGYSYEWFNGQKPHLILNFIRIQCNTENFLPMVVPSLSASSSSSLPSSTSMTPSGSKLIILNLPLARLLQHPRHLQRKLIIRITIPQSCQAKVWIGKYGETRILLKHQKSCCMNQPKSQNQIKKESRASTVPTYRNGCKISEFLNTETHTRVLLMNYL